MAAEEPQSYVKLVSMWRVLGILVFLLFSALVTDALIPCDSGDDVYAACVLDEMGRSVEGGTRRPMTWARCPGFDRSIAVKPIHLGLLVGHT